MDPLVMLEMFVQWTPHGPGMWGYQTLARLLGLALVGKDIV